jgi:chromosome segregation ATPase
MSGGESGAEAEPPDPLADCIAAANTKLADHFRSTGARESDLAGRRRYFCSLKGTYKARVGELARHADELSRTRRLLDASRRSHSEHIAAVAARIDREAEASERLLATSEDEAGLVAERRTTLSEVIGRVRVRTAALNAAKQELNVQRDELNRRMASLEKSAPKLSPVKISEEIQNLRQNLTQLNELILKTQKSVVSLELQLVSRMSRKRNSLENETETKAYVIGLQTHFEAERDALSQKLWAGRDQYLIVASNQMELNDTIERMLNNSQTLSAAIEQARESIFKTTRRIEELKAKIELAQEHIENSTRQCNRSKSLTVALAKRREKHGNDKVMELLSVRNEYRQTMYHIGKLSWTQKQNLTDESKLQDFCHSLTNKIQIEAELQSQLDSLDVEPPHHPVNEDELIEILGNIQQQTAETLQESRALKLASLRLIRPATVSRPKFCRTPRKLKRLLAKFSRENDG